MSRHMRTMADWLAVAEAVAATADRAGCYPVTDPVTTAWATSQRSVCLHVWDP